MKNEKITEALSHIDDKYLDEAAEYLKKEYAPDSLIETKDSKTISLAPKKLRIPIIACGAAAAAAAVFAVFAAFGQFNAQPITQQNSDFEKSVLSVVPNEEFVTNEDENGIVIVSYIGSSENVTVPQTINDKKVYRIGAGAFARNNTDVSVKSVILPYGITIIDENAFSDQKKLAEAVMPDTVVSIGTCAFFDTPSLCSIKLSSALTEIGFQAFGNSGLTEIVVPDSVEIIGAHAFSGCTELRNAHLPQNLSAMPEYLFRDCSSLSDVNIPPLVNSIGIGSFKNCKSLKILNIPQNVITICSEAFRNSGIKYINSDSNCSANLIAVKNIHALAFYGCENLAGINLGKAEHLGESCFAGCPYADITGTDNLCYLCRKGIE